MNIASYIARRFTFDKEGKKMLSRSIVQLSVFSISLSLAVMIIALAVLTGFKKEIRNRVIGFGGHVQILNFDSNESFESHAISANQDFLPELKKIPGVKHIQIFATKPGIIKAGKENQGVIAKGIGPDYDWSFFKSNMVEGNVFHVTDTDKTNDVVISKKLASLLNLSVGDEFPMFFFSDRPLPRRFKIIGLFETSLEEFDKQFILVDINHIRKLYGWTNDQISGFEILITDYKKIDRITEEIRYIAGFHFLEDGSRLRVEDIKEKRPDIFQWLNLLDMNGILMIILMIIVAIVNMISGLIILILDRTQTIGVLKAIGANNRTVKRIFLNQALFLIIKGMILGNIIAITMLLLQDKFQIMKLNQTSYFLDYVPVNLTLPILILTNLGSLLMIFIAMYLPTLIILRIEPVKTLRYA